MAHNAKYTQIIAMEEVDVRGWKYDAMLAGIAKTQNVVNFTIIRRAKMQRSVTVEHSQALVVIYCAAAELALAKRVSRALDIRRVVSRVLSVTKKIDLSIQQQLSECFLFVPLISSALVSIKSVEADFLHVAKECNFNTLLIALLLSL